MTIEKKFIQQNLKEFLIKEHIFNSLGKVGVAHLKLQRTPLGEKILVGCSRPGLVVGRGGSNIQRLTTELKEKFGLENPQIEIEELGNAMLEPAILAEMISNSLERFGAGRFKGIGHKAMTEAMNAGALGVEILISGKIPSQRAKTWRFYSGYLKKCGDVAVEGVTLAYRIALLKTGVVGIKVSVMPPTTILPDRIDINPAEMETGVEEVTGSAEAQELETTVEATEEKPKRKAPAKKKKDDGAAEEKPKRKAPAKKKKDEEAAANE
jgi:small subunit ribosomal protein S3